MVFAPWARRRFISSCVASESTPMSRPPRMTRNGAITTPANTICSPSCRLRSRCMDHQVQELTAPQTSTLLCGHIRRLSQQATDNLPRWGHCKQPCPQQPARDKHRRTPRAAPRRHQQPATTPQPRARRQVLTGHREVDRNSYSAPTLDPRAPAKAQFPWFEVSHGASHSSRRQR